MHHVTGAPVFLTLLISIGLGAYTVHILYPRRRGPAKEEKKRGDEMEGADQVAGGYTVQVG